MSAMVQDWSAAFRSRNRIERGLLGPLTTMRIGGPAELVVVDHRQDLAEVMERSVRFLGKGANLLIGDGGVAEPVLRLGPAFAELQLDRDAGVVRAGGAVDLAKLIGACVEAGLAGPEGLAGVPASVGGALRMNAGTRSCWIFDFVSRVEVLLPGATAPTWLDRDAVPAVYRSSGLPEGTLFIGCELRLKAGEPATLKAEAARLKKAKADTQPLAARSAGCVFKNPAPELPAGLLIDELGLKGSAVGAAQVSTVHGNFLINASGVATCDELCCLIRRVRRRAWQERGVVLELEVQTWNCPDELHAHPRDLSDA
jgi:UDP-N-acetylmuramate dehydrogenase